MTESAGRFFLLLFLTRSADILHFEDGIRGFTWRILYLTCYILEFARSIQGFKGHILVFTIFTQFELSDMVPVWESKWRVCCWLPSSLIECILHFAGGIKGFTCLILYLTSNIQGFAGPIQGFNGHILVFTISTQFEPVAMVPVWKSNWHVYCFLSAIFI